ncbi:MAG: alpha/beta hydrolase [Microbacterium sp.]
MPHTSTDETRIYYEVDGADDAPVILLIAGTGAQSNFWHPDFVSLLVAEGFRVVRPDNRDTGLSARFGDEEDLDGGYHLADMAGDVMRVLDDLRVAAAHLVGHSMGGMIAQMAVLEHPERVLSLSLVSTIPGQSKRYVLHGEAVIEQPTRFTVDEIVEFERVGVAADSPGTYEHNADWYAETARVAYERGYSPEGVVRQVSMLVRAPERLARLEKVTVPTLVFHGRDDPALHWHAALDIAEAIAGSELQVHPGMGHLVPFALWPELVAGIARTARRAQ